jgi:hypothetical protein
MKMLDQLHLDEPIKIKLGGMEGRAGKRDTRKLEIHQKVRRKTLI